MPTQEKVGSVATLKERLGAAKTAVLTEYRGLSVRQMSELRKQLKAAAAEYKVVKNRLARLAVKGSPLDALGAHLKGPTGLVYTKQDAVPVAKALQAFVRTNPQLTIKLGADERVRMRRPAPALRELERPFEAHEPPRNGNRRPSRHRSGSVSSSAPPCSSSGARARSRPESSLHITRKQPHTEADETWQRTSKRSRRSWTR